MRSAPLPAQFVALSDRINFVQRKSANEYCSTCPSCGGSPHSDGDWPDRFVMLLQSNTNGGAFGFCRICDYKYWEGRDNGKAIDPETIKLLEQQAQGYRQRQAEKRADKLAKFTTQELWEELHRRLTEDNRNWWRNAGVPDVWQDYLRLGYMADKMYIGKDGELHHSPAYTIPYFHDNFSFITMQYRLCQPENPVDRYRFEADLGTSYYMTTPNRQLQDQIIVCEGAKKAIVLRVYGGLDNDNISIVAVPSQADWQACGILDAVKHAGRVYICLDHDCFRQPDNAYDNWQPNPIRFAQAVGKAARVVEMPMKLDDAILQYNLQPAQFQRMLKYAARVKM